MKINKLIFTLGMMAIAITAHGQTSTISGVLLDSLTHEGEPYATIKSLQRQEKRQTSGYVGDRTGWKVLSKK